MKLGPKRFEALAERAFAEVPERVRKLLYNVEIAVQALPGPEAGRWKGSKTLLGLYTGLTREEMKGSAAYLPARVVLYQSNLEARCRTEEEVKAEVRTTLRHELAHHFGFTDEELEKVWPEGA